MKADWLDKLRVEVAGFGEEPPAGSFCAKDIQKRYGFKGHSAANRLMNKLIASGKVKAVSVRRKTSRGFTVVKYIVPK